MAWYSIRSFAQDLKPVLDISGPKSWSYLGQSEINKNGRYVLFTVEIESSDNNLRKKDLVIKSINGKWERKYDSVSNSYFSNDGKYVFFTKSNGKPYQFDLSLKIESEIIDRSPSIESLKQDTLNGYKFKENSKKLIIDCLITKEKDSLENVKSYIITSKRDQIVLVTQSEKSNESLILYDLKSKKKTVLWRGVTNEMASIDKDIKNNCILFEVRKSLPFIDPHLAEVDIWGYKDANYANPYQERKTETRCNYAVNTETHQVFQLTSQYERILAIKGGFAIIDHNQGVESVNEKFWNEKARSTYYLMSLTDGNRRTLAKESKEEISLDFSPDAKYILISNKEALQYSSYNTKTGLICNISKGQEICLRGLSYMDVKFLSTDFTFLENHYVIVRDEFDLWKLDLTGQKAPLNLTGGYGRENRIVFRSINLERGRNRERFSKELNGYIIAAFDEKDKSRGFYQLKNLNGGKPTQLSMGSYYYGGDDPIVKRAKDEEVYLIRRERVNESPALFATTDFKAFTQLSNVKPEKDYSQLSVDLIHWKDRNGRDCDGLLYKPENFDPKIKYPVVTVIYGGFSSHMNQFVYFKADDLGYANFLPVAWLVNNGYLVFIPDIEKAKRGEFLKNSCDVLIPGVEYIASLPYIDSKKIGLQGTSWGGIQINYILTQTNLFAAAYSGAAFSEYISRSGFSDQISHDYNMPGKGEHFGGVLTDVPESYINQSALFFSNKIKTQILIRHNKLDGVPFYQGLQFFRMLRRIGKKAWLLQYDHEGHGVISGKNLGDMNLRIAQFFDHYLKDKPAPKWMTQGIAPEYKQIDSGLELDAPGVIP